jgi:mRNA-degrading endonuclease RelE of RelBE toxin-antitoxin system
MGDGYEVLVSQEVRELLDSIDEKSGRIVRENLEKLTEPHPGKGQGDKERITWRGEEVYRLHVGRTWTAFYDAEGNDDAVYVLRVMPIDDAHEEYGGLG